jgi:hypothetical protein
MGETERPAGGLKQTGPRTFGFQNSGQLLDPGCYIGPLLTADAKGGLSSEVALGDVKTRQLPTGTRRGRRKECVRQQSFSHARAPAAKCASSLSSEPVQPFS